MTTTTLHERAIRIFATWVVLDRIAQIRRYSRAPAAKKKAKIHTLTAHAMRRAVAEAMRPMLSSPRLGIDSGRGSGGRPGAAWLDAADCDSIHGWQLYAVAIRDLVLRRYPVEQARDIAAALTCEHPLASSAAVRGVRPPEVDAGLDWAAAWSAWAATMRQQPISSAQMGRRTRRWLDANARERAALRMRNVSA